MRYALSDAERFSYQASVLVDYSVSDRIALAVHALATFNADHTSEQLYGTLSYRW